MLLVRVTDRLCALPIAQVCEVMRPLPIHRFVHAPDGVAGLAVVRGMSIPVVDLSLLTSSAASSAGSARFVTIRVDQRLIALAVSEVVGVRAIDRATLSSLPPLLDGGKDEAITALGVRDKQLLLVLDAARLLPEGEFIGTAAESPP